MVDLVAIQGAVTGLKAAIDVAKSMVSLHDSNAFQLKSAELLERLGDALQSQLSAYAEQSSLLNRVRDLEQQILKLEQWSTEKQRYELTELRNGKLAYTVKESMRGEEPPHQLCANCYNQGEKSFLQLEIRPGRHKFLVCHRCKSAIQISGGTHQ